MGDIKSALEKAMQKVESLEKATAEERQRWQYVPEGEKLAAEYMKDRGNLLTELGKYDKDVTAYIAEGAAEILVRNINLPKNDLAKRNNKRAMEAIKILKTDKVGVENVFSKMRRVFNHYVEQGEQQRKQAYGALKADFEARMRQTAQQQLGHFANIKIDVEKQPQFHEEWRRLQAQLDSQYHKLLDEFKQELLAVP